MNASPAHINERGENPRRMRGIAERAFSRAGGAPLVGGNDVQLLLNGRANFDEWLCSIRAAEKTIYLENYIIRADDVGREFLDALTRKAASGVKVRVLLDWLGSMRTSYSFWKPLLKMGGEVRYHNPPRFDSPLGWLSRDHRKSLVVDGCRGFVSGVCLSATWLGNPDMGVEPWRDTGIALSGPACRDLVLAFADVWDESGERIPDEEISALQEPLVAGDVHVRVIATAPNIAGIYRMDLLIAAIATKRLWLTDAYFAGLPAYVQALRAAARDGVDVRLLVPGGSDLPWLRPLTTAGYRPLLECGVRVFEWNGSMLHAKTAVADGLWARVGSTNLNISSWLANYELDVAVEDAVFARQMEAAYEADILRSTEVVLQNRRAKRIESCSAQRSRPGGGSIVRVTAGALRLGRTVGAAVTNRRTIGKTEAWSLAWIALIPLAIALLMMWLPYLFAYFFAAFLVLLAVSLLVRAYRLRFPK